MIKKLHEITLKDIILLDATKSANSLKKYWFVPLFLCRKELELLTKQIFDSIGSQTIDDLQDEFDKLLSYRRLQLLEALYKAVNIEFSIKSRINAWKIILQKDFKESEQLEKVLEEVKTHTGIEIKTPESLKELNDYIQHKIDKYKEMYPEIVKETVSIVSVLRSIFNCMKEPINMDMLLIVWLDLKDEAIKKIRQNKPEDNGEYTGNS